MAMLDDAYPYLYYHLWGIYKGVLHIIITLTTIWHQNVQLKKLCVCVEYHHNLSPPPACSSKCPQCSC